MAPAEGPTDASFPPAAEFEAVGSNEPTLLHSDPVSPMDAEDTSSRPSLSSKRPASRRDIKSRGGSMSPPAVSNQSNEDGADEDAGLLLDPRRFTPTLHASLVSEILNLRRDLDSKHRIIEDLETHLHTTKVERDEVDQQLRKSEKEQRSLKRQFQQLENGTLTALEELAKERDELKKRNVDLTDKVEEEREKLKKSREDSDRTHEQWGKEQAAWENERRTWERKLHVAESRLAAALRELENVALHHQQLQHVPEEDGAKDSGLGEESDTASQASPRRNVSSPSPTRNRAASSASRRSFQRFSNRFSVQSHSDWSRGNGKSLADELHLDEEDEYEETEMADVMSEAGSEVPSIVPEMVAKRVVASRPERVTLVDSPTRTRTVLEAPFELSSRLPEPKKAAAYVEMGVQCNPDDVQPAAETVIDVITTPKTYCDSAIQYDDTLPYPVTFLQDSSTNASTSIDRAEQMSPVPPLSPKKSSSQSMVSSSSQTVDEPLSPPATPSVSPPLSPMEFPPYAQIIAKAEMRTVSTQTDFASQHLYHEELEEYPEWDVSLMPGRIPHHEPQMHMPIPIPIPIPSITITSPPSDAPSTPERNRLDDIYEMDEPRLPPQTKSISTQTTSDLEPPHSVTSVSVQTEEIRFDRRLLAKLPAHLRPETLEESLIEKKLKGKGKAREDEDAIKSGNASERVDGLRRMLRGAVLGPAFEAQSGKNEEEKESKPVVQGYSTPNMNSRSLKGLRGLAGRTRPSPVPEEKDEGEETVGGADESSSPEQVSKILHQNLQRYGGIRRSVVIQSTTINTNNTSGATSSAPIEPASHRSRTPSIVSVGSSSFYSNRSVGPPFPVPDRGSSKKLFSSRSEGSQSPTPKSGSLFSRRSSRTLPRKTTTQSTTTSAPIGIERKDSLRKVRSAAAIPNGRRSRSNSPPLPIRRSREKPREGGKSKYITTGPTPPLPTDNIFIPPKVYPSQAAQKSGEKIRVLKGKTSQKVTRETPPPLPQNAPLALPTAKPELARASQGTVVDAIAATMVGEWMFKYVRRRTSFGVPTESEIGRPGTDGTSSGGGTRHKRWVWLSPYERSIMWSSKQPSSNSALLGNAKSGRKLLIQSVLDVRDDTPLPKNHGIAEQFGRSILILTPARALKFTAMSKERHYTWLTALSFLAHSPLLAPGLAIMPPTTVGIEEERPGSGRKVSAPASIPSGYINEGGMKRGGIRDSVRIAKDRARPKPMSRRTADAFVPPTPTFSPDEMSLENGSYSQFNPNEDFDEEDYGAAEAPNVPRSRGGHGRKRSLTGPARYPTGAVSALRKLGIGSSGGSGTSLSGYKEVPAPAFAMMSPGGGGGGGGSFNSAAGVPVPTVPAMRVLTGSDLMLSASVSRGSTPRTTSDLSRKDVDNGMIRMDAFIDDGDDGPQIPGNPNTGLGPLLNGYTPSPVLSNSSGSGGSNSNGSFSPGMHAGLFGAPYGESRRMSSGKREGLVMDDDFDIGGMGMPTGMHGDPFAEHSYVR